MAGHLLEPTPTTSLHPSRTPPFTPAQAFLSRSPVAPASGAEAMHAAGQDEGLHVSAWRGMLGGCPRRVIHVVVAGQEVGTLTIAHEHTVHLQFCTLGPTCAVRAAHPLQQRIGRYSQEPVWELNGGWDGAGRCGPGGAGNPCPCSCSAGNPCPHSSSLVCHVPFSMIGTTTGGRRTAVRHPSCSCKVRNGTK